MGIRPTSDGERRADAFGRGGVTAVWVVGLTACHFALAGPAVAESGKVAQAEEVSIPEPVAAIAVPGVAPTEQKAATLAVPPKPSRIGDNRALYRAIIEREVRNTSLPADVAEAVMGVESGYDPTRIGADGEIGLMQVMPATARMLGFTGSMSEFAAPEINIRYGMIYLAQAWSKAGGDLCTALMKYRAGHGEMRFSHLSVEYCLRARARLVARGYQVTGIVPTATFGLPIGATMRCRGRCLTLGGAGRVDFAALNSRLTQVVMQVGPKPMAR